MLENVDLNIENVKLILSRIFDMVNDEITLGNGKLYYNYSKIIEPYKLNRIHKKYIINISCVDDVIEISHLKIINGKVDANTTEQYYISDGWYNILNDLSMKTFAHSDTYIVDEITFKLLKILRDDKIDNLLIIISKLSVYLQYGQTNTFNI